FERRNGILLEDHKEISDPESNSYSSDDEIFLALCTADDQGYRPNSSEIVGVDGATLCNRVDTSVIITLQGS
ncbi:hypothetical protein ILUMI_05687, partial [Ignelater luminosus]